MSEDGKNPVEGSDLPIGDVIARANAELLGESGQRDVWVVWCMVCSRVIRIEQWRPLPIPQLKALATGLGYCTLGEISLVEAVSLFGCTCAVVGGEDTRKRKE